MERSIQRILLQTARLTRSFRSFRHLQQQSSVKIRLGGTRNRLLEQIFSCRRFFQVSALCFLPAVHAAVTKAEMSSAGDADTAASVEDIVKHADELYVQNQVDELYEYMKKFSGSTEADVLWRLARATCDKAKSTTDKTLRKELMYDAFKAAEQALKLGDSNFACHKWYAILLDYIGEYEGTKERISKAYKIREHFLKAIELNPRDATSVHLLGYWCFVFADMPWYQKKVAAVIFATPPSSTYQEALDRFLEAERIDPGFYSMNLLMIGKTYLRLKDNEQAKKYLLQTRDLPVRTEDDKQANKESIELLQSLGVK